VKLAVLLVLVACGQEHTPKPRTRDELVAQLAAAGSDHHVRPPTEQELMWITDTSVGDPLPRSKQAVAVMRDELRIGMSYAGDERKAAAWRSATLATCAALADVVVDEIAPLSATYPDTTRVVRDLVSTVRDVVIDLVDTPRSPDERRVMNETFHVHATSLRKVLTPDDCARMAAAAPDIASDLHDCLGGTP
jgi:hypothetical protein